MKRVFVDRIEPTESGESLAVLLVPLGEGDYLRWLCPLAWLPPKTREGTWLRIEFTPDPETQAQLRSEIESLLSELQEE
ncbi:MAG: DUF3006 domain-containing protein [Armatimonadota bacterium]|nr:DUF3006 domain-containing protein [Armatimonadota bacterium]